MNEVIDLVSCLFGLILSGVIVWWGAAAAWSSYETGEYVGSVARVHVFPARVALLIGLGVLFVRLSFELTQHIQRLAGRGDGPPPAPKMR
jgi:hypothetical protein